MILKTYCSSKENLSLILNKMLPFRNDFKKLMKEKNEVEMLQEQQRLEMDNIAFELEKKMRHDESPISSPKKSKNSCIFSNLNINFSTPHRTSMINFFNLKGNSKNHGDSSAYSTRESPLLSNFKTQVLDGFDTSQRINSNLLKSSRKLFKIEEDIEPTPYLIKNTFVKKGTNSQIGFHRQIKSEIPFINKEIIFEDLKQKIKNPNKMNIEIIEGQTRNPNNMRNFSMPRHQSLETLQFNGMNTPRQINKFESNPKFITKKNIK